MSKKQQKKKQKLLNKIETAIAGKFYFAKFSQQSFMPPRWEPVEASKDKEGNCIFKMTGISGTLDKYDIIDFKKKPIKLPDMQSAKRNTL